MADPLPTLRQLTYLLALARRRSFSKAAEDCLVSQSTLSAGVKELEGVLGVEVVDRTGREIRLTSAGEEAAAQAQSILSAAEEMVRAARHAQPLAGPFRLGVIPTIAPFLLPLALPEVKRLYPNLQLFLREDLTANLIDLVLGGQLDAALMAFPYDAAGIATRDIGADRFWYVGPPGGAAVAEMSFDKLAEAELLLLEDGHCLRDHALAACRLQNPGQRKAFGATSLFTLLQMTENGLGATLAPEMALAAGLAKGLDVELRPFQAPAPERRIGFAWRAGTGREKDVHLLADIFTPALAQARFQAPAAA